MDPPTMDMAFTSVAQFFSKAPQMQSEDLQNGYVWSSFKTSDQFCFVRMPINYLDEALLEAESARSSTLVPLHPLQNSARYGAISTQHDNQTIDPRVLQSMEDALSFDPNTPNSYQATGQLTQNNVPTLTIGSPTLGNWPLFGGYTYPDPTNLEGLHGVQPNQQATSSGNNALGGRRVRSRASASSSNNAPRTRRVRVPASASSSNNAPRPHARTYAPRATQAQHTAMQALEGAQDILRNVFNVTIGQPFNPGWMEDNNVDHAILKGLVCVPSRVKWEVICNWGLFQPGDLLHVPTAAATTGAASVSTDATVRNSQYTFVRSSY